MGKVQRALQKVLHVGGIARAEKEEEEREQVQVPRNVPAGFLVVYVGKERRRFVISAKIRKHERIRVLLEKSAKEFGYKHDDGYVIIIACDVASFQHLLQAIETKSPSLCRMQSPDYWAFAPDNPTHYMVD